MQTHLTRLFPLSSLVLAAVFLSSPAFGQDPGLLGPHMDMVNTEPCLVCHDDANPPNWLLFAMPPPTGWGTKPIAAKCYSCHDAAGGFLATAARDMTMNAYSDYSHSFYVPAAPEAPEGSPDSSTGTSGLPYDDILQELECTTCHDVHDSTIRPFLRAPLAQLCSSCHAGRANDGNLSRSMSVPGGTRNYSTHPTKVPPGATPTARMKDLPSMDANLRVSTPPPPNYQLGGHLDDGTLQPTGDIGNVDCGTCHAIHGPTMGLGGTNDLLAIENWTESAGPFVGSALCEGCHYGGAAGGDVGTYPAGPGEHGDHPLDSRSANWAGIAGLIPSPPLSWMLTTPNLDRGAMPFLAAGTPACSSCHDIHGGMADTPLLRGPAPGISNGAAPWTFDYEDWCFSCHDRFQTTPTDLNHNDPDVICGDCHGADNVLWTSHNGFWTTFDCTVTENPETTCGDGIDNDCDGLVDIDDPDCPINPDGDNDGYDSDVDCDDNDPAVNPGAAEIPYNGIDENCNGMIDDDDLDFDGFGIAVDCDDSDPAINPSACDIKSDGIDQDCDGTDRTKGKACPVPTSSEICDNGVDDDGDNKIDCSDRDCRDDAACSGGTVDPEICDDGIDNDNDGKVDCADKGDCRKDPYCN